MEINICQSLESLKKNVLSKFCQLPPLKMLVYHRDVASATAFPNGYFKYVTKMIDLSCLRAGDEIYVYPSGQEEQAKFDLMLPCKCAKCLAYMFEPDDPRAIPDPNYVTNPWACKLGDAFKAGPNNMNNAS